MIKAGDTISYIICKDLNQSEKNSTSFLISMKAYHPDELTNNPSLIIGIAVDFN